MCPFFSSVFWEWQIPKFVKTAYSNMQQCLVPCNVQNWLFSRNSFILGNLYLVEKSWWGWQIFMNNTSYWLSLLYRSPNVTRPWISVANYCVIHFLAFDIWCMSVSHVLPVTVLTRKSSLVFIWHMAQYFKTMSRKTWDTNFWGKFYICQYRDQVAL